VDKLHGENEKTVRLCNYTDVYYRRLITNDIEFMAGTATDDEIRKFSLRAGDVMFTKDSETFDDIGIPSVADAGLDNVVLGYHVMLARPGTKLHGPFLAWFFTPQRNRWQFEISAKGVTRFGMPQSGFKDAICSLPPLDEQRAIAEFLDAMDERINRYIAAKRRIIQLLEEKKQAIINQAAIRGLDPDVPLKPSGVDWLGDIPTHWNVVPLRRVTESRCDGPFGSSLKSDHYVETGVRVVRLQNIGNSEFRGGDAAYIDSEYYSTIGNHDVQKGDILIAGLGDEPNPAGRACVAPAGIEPAMVKADCFRFRLVRNTAIPGFLAHQLTSTAVGFTGAMSTGATRQRVNLQNMSSRIIAIPPIQEQEEILAKLAAISGTLGTSIAREHRTITLVEEFRTRLIADVVTGKLDVRGVDLPHLEMEAITFIGSTDDGLLNRDDEFVVHDERDN
jgi:type I restriction enzyme S subunit